MGEGNGTSHALRPPGVYPGRCAANGCPGLKTGVAAAHAGDLPLWNASADLHMHRCTSQAQVFSPSETSWAEEGLQKNFPLLCATQELDCQ
jgi:hypothetical protein